MTEARENLRAITYLSPSLPVELFETILEYLEEVTGRDGYLTYESRWSGPPKDRVDPFTSNLADIGFMSSTDFLRMAKDGNKSVVLCGAGAVFNHKKNTGRPVYYSDVIINARNKSKYKELHDLRGHILGFTDKSSLSSCVSVLDYLKKQGADASFFSDTYLSGSHIGLIKSVLDGRVDVAAVDSNALHGFLTQHPNHVDDVHVINSFGPLPTYPINTTWSRRLAQYNVTGFVQTDSSLYDLETDLVTGIGKLTMSSTYY
ncbi:hypothetical protein MAR_007872 [Mya arenaria]|uniref:Uncharacterized protein n=1 Tax=Mya arenaria TaxID=6604 RepID=A0ABY7DW84_MYAAR|nr:hypothetical protein MAR_007872 [Mya arenaria]